jgi:hypothetical protein
MDLEGVKNVVPADEDHEYYFNVCWTNNAYDQVTDGRD